MPNRVLLTHYQQIVNWLQLNDKIISLNILCSIVLNKGKLYTCLFQMLKVQAIQNNEYGCKKDTAPAKRCRKHKHRYKQCNQIG